MGLSRKQHDADFKKKVALEAIKQQKTVNQITSEYGVHATQVAAWQKQATEAIEEAFTSKRESSVQASQAEDIPIRFQDAGKGSAPLIRGASDGNRGHR